MAIHGELRGDKRGKRFCPMMGEWCTKGWTPKMGRDPDGAPLHGACAAWQPVAVTDPKTQQTTPLFDCTAFGWPADLATEIALNVYRNTASTDKVANQVLKHRAEFVGALPPEAQERAMRLTLPKGEEKNGN